MEPALLIIITVLTIALIFIAKKYITSAAEVESEDGEVSISVPFTSGTSSSTSATNKTQQSEEKSSASVHNTIYEFSSKAGERLCPFCDGENRVGVKVCNICGRSI